MTKAHLRFAQATGSLLRQHVVHVPMQRCTGGRYRSCSGQVRLLPDDSEIEYMSQIRAVLSCRHQVEGLEPAASVTREYSVRKECLAGMTMEPIESAACDGNARRRNEEAPLMKHE